MYNPFSLSGKRILISGASSGIGRAISIECSKMGAEVYLLGRNQDRLAETFNSLEHHKGHKIFPVELTSQAEINELVNAIDAVDGVVHAAGILKRLPFKFLNLEVLSEIMSVNFSAPALLTKQLFSKKKINSEGSIVFISSISGSYCSSVGNSLYSASKGALNALAKNIALEVAVKNIRVNIIHPGMVDTNMHSERTFAKEELKRDIENYPLNRYGKPEDVAHAAIYLLSGASSWVTGTSLLLDGGFTLK